jgi:hypothetical protein
VTTQDNPQAFPKLTGLDPSWYDDDARRSGAQPSYFNADTEGGMTLRDYFAAKVLQGLCATGDVWPRNDDGPEMARKAYLFADAMLKARAQ